MECETRESETDIKKLLKLTIETLEKGVGDKVRYRQNEHLDF